MKHLTPALASHGLRSISVTPIELKGKIWLCVGFEETKRYRGDFMHFAMIYDASIDFLQTDNLHEALHGLFAGAGHALVRIHSECMLSEAFGSTMCDCADQLRLAQDEMLRRGQGVLLYLRQEGRGIGMRNKLEALALQYGFANGRRTECRHSSDEANIALGHKVDERSYEVAPAFLRAVGIRSASLITGNPEKISALTAGGVEVRESIDLWNRELSPRAKAELEEKVSRNYSYARFAANVAN